MHCDVQKLVLENIASASDLVAGNSRINQDLRGCTSMQDIRDKIELKICMEDEVMVCLNIVDIFLARQRKIFEVETTTVLVHFQP